MSASAPVPTPTLNSSPFPIMRADLFDPKSSKLETTLVQAFEHPDDTNYVRNKVNNISLSILSIAKSGRKLGVHRINVNIIDKVVSGLKANFPDVQIVNRVDSKDANIHILTIFWT